jgi:hypothetical protein
MGALCHDGYAASSGAALVPRAALTLPVKEFDMDMKLDPADDVLSPAKSRSLVVVALTIALLGLTTLDVAPSVNARRHAGDPHSFDCIVASAIFAGVNPSSSSADAMR